MAWFKQLFDLVETEYDRRIRSASNIIEYHPEGGGHGHGHDDHPVEEEGGGGGTEGLLHGAAGAQFTDRANSTQTVAKH